MRSHCDRTREFTHFAVKCNATGYGSWYRSGTVNSKSFVGKVLLQIKWKLELVYAL